MFIADFSFKFKTPMKKQLLLPQIIFFAFIFAFTNPSQAQTYYQVTVLTGTQLLGNTTVTVVGTGGNFGYYNFCTLMPGPYLPGNSSPGNFLFSFSTPVQSLRFTTHGMENLEVNSIEINGAPYMLGPANNLIVCPTCTGTCQDPIGSFVGGNLIGVPGSGGQFTIDNVAGGISSVRFSNNGQQAGTGFSIEFQEGLPVEATNNGPVCWGDTLKLFGSSIPSATYSWSGPNGFSSSQQNPIIPNPNQLDAGDYVLTVNGQYTDTTIVSLLPRPSNPIITFNSPVCLGTTLNLSATSTPAGALFSWIGPNGFTSAISNPSISNVQNIHSGTYTVQAEIGTCKSDSTSVLIEVKEPTSSLLNKTICEGESYNFNGDIKLAAGLYIDTFVNAAGCDSLAKLNLTIRPPLSLTIDYDHDRKFCIGDTVTLTATGATSYFWVYGNMDLSLGDGSAKNVSLINPQNKYTLTGTDTNNCKGSKEVVIEAEPCCDIMTPNAFSPNNDGNNDAFGVSTAGFIREFEMRIYDRLGHIVFVSFNTNNKWDGTINKKPANAGVYYYVIKGKCDFGPDIFLKGDLTLIR